MTSTARKKAIGRPVQRALSRANFGKPPERFRGIEFNLCLRDFRIASLQGAAGETAEPWGVLPGKGERFTACQPGILRELYRYESNIESGPRRCGRLDLHRLRH